MRKTVRSIQQIHEGAYIIISGWDYIDNYLGNQCTLNTSVQKFPGSKISSNSSSAQMLHMDDFHLGNLSHVPCSADSSRDTLKIGPI